jgi:hypothetical protein
MTPEIIVRVIAIGMHAAHATAQVVGRSNCCCRYLTTGEFTDPNNATL